MANKELIVDDEYCKKMGEYFKSQGEQIDKCISEYLSIMNNIKNAAIVRGDTNSALATYISKTSQLKGQILSLSSSAKTMTETFVRNIDVEDQYLF